MCVMRLVGNSDGDSDQGDDDAAAAQVPIQLVVYQGGQLYTFSGQVTIVAKRFGPVSVSRSPWVPMRPVA